MPTVKELRQQAASLGLQIPKKTTKRELEEMLSSARGDNGLLVVQFAAEDYAGVGAKIQAALQAAGHRCRLVVDHDNYLRYPKDLHPTDPEVADLVDQADVIICHSFLSSVPGWGSAKRFYYVHGSRFRQHSATYLRAAARAKARVLCSTPDLLRHSESITWNPTPIDPSLRESWAPQEGLVVHSPTSRRGKGTSAFLAAASAAAVEMDIIERVSNKECLARKAHGWACFDSFEIGMQVSGIEAAAFGMPVLAGGDDFVLRKVVERAGFQPYAWVQDQAGVEAQLRRLKNDRDYYDIWAQRSRRYIDEIHGYPAAAKFMLGLFSE